MSIASAIARAKIRLRDRIRYLPAVRESYATCRWLKSVASPRTEAKLANLAVAYRHANSKWLTQRLDKSVAPWLAPLAAGIWRNKQIGWRLNSWHPRIADQFINKSLILKEPRPLEKGILYVAFEYNWLRLLNNCDLKKLLEEYYLVLAPTNSPPGLQYLWSFARATGDPVFVGICNVLDLALYQRFAEQANLHPVPLMTCDFVDPDFYHPKPHAKREIDILMVAGWGRVKRHWLLFQALRRMRRGLRVVLIGKDLDGRTANDVFREAKAFSVADRIEILRDVPFEAVADYQCNARISLILSQQEGSCVAVTESLFADTPMGMMEGAHVGPVAYINPHTGKLLRAETTHLTLSEMIERSSEFGAREWALNHISCSLSSAKLNRALRKHAEASGAAWTTDIRTFCWRRTPEYLNPDDSRQMAAAHAELYRHHGVRVLGYSTAGTLSQEPV